MKKMTTKINERIPFIHVTIELHGEKRDFVVSVSVVNEIINNTYDFKQLVNEIKNKVNSKDYLPNDFIEKYLNSCLNV